MQSLQFRDLATLNLRQASCLLAEELFSPILQWLPFFLGSPFRWLFLKLFAKKVGRQLFVAQNVSFRHCYNLVMGDFVSINQDTIIHSRGGVTIGNHVLMGQRVIINTGDHEYAETTTPIREQRITYKPIRIGNDVFLGMGAIIMSGINIADGTVVAAGAVVTKDTEPRTVVGGVPARVIARRGPSSSSAA